MAAAALAAQQFNTGAILTKYTPVSAAKSHVPLHPVQVLPLQLRLAVLLSAMP